MPNTRIFMLCNPQNPTGRVFSRNELKMMGDVCLENGIFIFSDEIHSDLIYPRHEHIPIASLSPELADITVTLSSPTKTFNIAGIKASFAVIKNATLKEKLLHAKRGLVGWVNVFCQLGLKASYEMGSSWLDELLAYLDNNRQFTYDFVTSNLPVVTMDRPDATYLAWLDCRQTGIDDPKCSFWRKLALL